MATLGDIRRSGAMALLLGIFATANTTCGVATAAGTCSAGAPGSSPTVSEPADGEDDVVQLVEDLTGTVLATFGRLPF